MKKICFLICLFFFATGLHCKCEEYKSDRTRVLKNTSSDNFSANCIGDLKSIGKSAGPSITIENDSVIINIVQNMQCCPMFNLSISEIANDTLFVTFYDTTSFYCNCMCDFEIRISAAELTSQNINVVHYNGKAYELKTSSIKRYQALDMQIFPNPAKEQITFRLSENKIKQIQIYNIKGTLINTIDVSNNASETIYNISNYKAGVYLYRIRNNKNQDVIGKFIVL